MDSRYAQFAPGTELIKRMDAKGSLIYNYFSVCKDRFSRFHYRLGATERHQESHRIYWSKRCTWHQVSESNVCDRQKTMFVFRIPDFTYREVLKRIPDGTRIDIFNHSTNKQKILPVSTIVDELEYASFKFSFYIQCDFAFAGCLIRSDKGRTTCFHSSARAWRWKIMYASFHFKCLRAKSFALLQIDPPQVVRELDWAQRIFPKRQFLHRGYVKVQK